MKKPFIALAAAGLLLSACGGAPASQSAAPASEQKTEQAAPQGGAKVLAKPVFIDFYAPW
jgi:hypothetical protein